ncbi:hypothetical protein D9Q98_004953 [Chlorella vulgaris]|uniref:Uncharacterized protein n=1 Tax=Chlorella vulgaris TaxID=3077 RepID=A0A9D4TN70_CHLVU|nr:hypothetical protein D9Q98_004953 [Chlorella vulgaris]
MLTCLLSHDGGSRADLCPGAGVQAAVQTGLVTSRALQQIAHVYVLWAIPSSVVNSLAGGWCVRAGVDWMAGAASLGLLQQLLLLEQGTGRTLVELIGIWVPVALSAYGFKRIVDALKDWVSKWAAYRAASKATLIWAILADQWLEAEWAQQALQELQPQQALEAQQQS